MASSPARLPSHQASTGRLFGRTSRGTSQARDADNGIELSRRSTRLAEKASNTKTPVSNEQLEQDLAAAVNRLKQDGRRGAGVTQEIKNAWRHIIQLYSNKHQPQAFPQWALDELGPELVLVCIRAEFPHHVLETIWRCTFPRICNDLSAWLGLSCPEMLALFFGADKTRTPAGRTISTLVKALEIKNGDSEDTEEAEDLGGSRITARQFQVTVYPTILKNWAERQGQDLNTWSGRHKCVLARQPITGTFEKSARINHDDFRFLRKQDGHMADNAEQLEGDGHAEKEEESDASAAAPSHRHRRAKLDHPDTPIPSGEYEQGLEAAAANIPKAKRKDKGKGKARDEDNESMKEAGDEGSGSVEYQRAAADVELEADNRDWSPLERMFGGNNRQEGESQLTTDFRSPGPSRYGDVTMEFVSPGDMSSQFQPQQSPFRDLVNDGTPDTPAGTRKRGHSGPADKSKRPKTVTALDAAMAADLEEQDKWLSGAVVWRFLTMAASCTASTAALDLPVEGNNDMLSTASAKISVGILDAAAIGINVFVSGVHFRSHWTLLTLDNSGLSLYDSFQSYDNLALLGLLENTLGKLLDHKHPLVHSALAQPVQQMQCPRQGDANNCGVFIIVFAFYKIAGLRLPGSLHIVNWRLLLAAMLRRCPLSLVLPRQIIHYDADAPLPPAPDAAPPPEGVLPDREERPQQSLAAARTGTETLSSLESQVARIETEIRAVRAVATARKVLFSERRQRAAEMLQWVEKEASPVLDRLLSGIDQAVADNSEKSLQATRDQNALSHILDQLSTVSTVDVVATVADTENMLQQCGRLVRLLQQRKQAADEARFLLEAVRLQNLATELRQTLGGYDAEVAACVALLERPILCSVDGEVLGR